MMLRATSETGLVRKSEARRRTITWFLLIAVILTLAAVGVPAWRRHLADAALRDARVALSHGRDVTALERAYDAARLAPDRAETEYLLAVAYRGAGEFGLMEQRLRRAEQLGWSADAIQRQRWLARAQTGDVDQVMLHLAPILERGATDEVAREFYDAIVKGHLSRYRLQEAWQAVQFWLRWRPDDVQGRLYRADIYERLGKNTDAAADYRRILEVAPDHHQAALNLGQALLLTNEIPEARERFLHVLERRPQDPEALIGLAQSERRLGDPAAARRRAEAALELPLNPFQRAAALAEVGQILLNERNPTGAIPLLAEAVRLAPAESPHHHALAMAYALAGDAARAEHHRSRVTTIRAQYNRMNEITARLIETPDDPDLRAQAGALLMEQGLEDEGAQWLVTALDCDPGHRAAHQALADYYARSGNRQLAARHRLLASESAEPPPAEDASQGR